MFTYTEMVKQLNKIDLNIFNFRNIKNEKEQHLLNTLRTSNLWKEVMNFPDREGDIDPNMSKIKFALESPLNSLPIKMKYSCGMHPTHIVKAKSIKNFKQKLENKQLVDFVYYTQDDIFKLEDNVEEYVVLFDPVSFYINFEIDRKELNNLCGLFMSIFNVSNGNKTKSVLASKYGFDSYEDLMFASGGSAGYGGILCLNGDVLRQTNIRDDFRMTINTSNTTADKLSVTITSDIYGIFYTPLKDFFNEDGSVKDLYQDNLKISILDIRRYLEKRLLNKFA